jgi:ubiquitin-protein ligase
MSAKGEQKMASLSPRERRLKNTFFELQELGKECVEKDPNGTIKRQRFEFSHNGNVDEGLYPDTYEIILHMKGVKSPTGELQTEHHFTLYLPSDFPAIKPVVRWHTPIFHPNIITFEPNNEYYQNLLQEFGSEEEMFREIREHPELAELMDGYVCLDALRENWTPTLRIRDLVVELANMVRMQTYNLSDPLNPLAAKWVKEREGMTGEGGKLRFPIDISLLEHPHLRTEVQIIENR